MRESTPEPPSVRARSRFRSRWRSRRWWLSEKTEPRPAPQRSRLILAGSAAYLVLIFGVMLWRGVSIEPAWGVRALPLLALALGRGRRVIIDWLPFFILFLPLQEVRGVAAQTGGAPAQLSGVGR